MPGSPQILAFAGSIRSGSFNRRLVKVAAQCVRDAGLPCTLIELGDYPLPIYNGDLEEQEGVPSNALKLRELMFTHQGLLIVSPEYNSSISPLLKNVIDWVSRSPQDNQGLAPYKDKIAAIMSASPGGLGGLRGLVTLRSILGNIGVMVIPDQFALRQAHQAFADTGEIVDADEGKRVRAASASLVGWVSRTHVV